MTGEDPSPEWERLWKEFNTSLKTWNESFEYLQKATNDVQSRYNEAITKTWKDSNDKTVSQFIETWQKYMGDTGMKTFEQFSNTSKSSDIAQKTMIKMPGNAINKLISLGNSFGMRTSILEDASKIINDSNHDNGKTACGKLSMFINQVNQNPKLTSLQKDLLVKDANAIKTSIGCK
jgi:hypothetical protein